MLDYKMNNTDYFETLFLFGCWIQSSNYPDLNPYILVFAGMVYFLRFWLLSDDTLKRYGENTKGLFYVYYIIHGLAIFLLKILIISALFSFGFYIGAVLCLLAFLGYYYIRYSEISW